MNDINAELVNFWRMIQSVPADIHAGVKQLPNTPETYYDLRAVEPTILADVDRAIRFCYLNRYSFNGLYRTNRKGQYNVPYGGKRCGAVPSLDDFLDQSQRLASTSFYCADFEAFIQEHARENDFLYLDPPYAVQGSRVSGEYDLRAFRADDIERLIACLDHIESVGATFLLSYADDADLTDRLSHRLRGRYDVRRRIAGFRANRATAQEIAFSNYELQ